MSGAHRRRDCAGGAQRPCREVHRRRPVARPHAQPSSGTARCSGRSDRHSRIEARRGNGRFAVDRSLRHPRRYRGWPGPGCDTWGAAKRRARDQLIGPCATAAQSAAASPMPIPRPIGFRAWRPSAPAWPCGGALDGARYRSRNSCSECLKPPCCPASSSKPLRCHGCRREARWGFYKVCRKTGEFAHAIGAVLFDPAGSVCRAVIGATEGRPVVFSSARELFRGRPEAGLSNSFDHQPARQALAAAGMTDAIRQQLHLVALRRAIEQASS